MMGGKFKFQTPSFRGGSKHEPEPLSLGRPVEGFKPLHFGADLSTRPSARAYAHALRFQTPSFRGGSKHQLNLVVTLTDAMLFQTPSFRGGSKHAAATPSRVAAARCFKPLHFGADLST